MRMLKAACCSTFCRRKVAHLLALAAAGAAAATAATAAAAAFTGCRLRRVMCWRASCCCSPWLAAQALAQAPSLQKHSWTSTAAHTCSTAACGELSWHAAAAALAAHAYVRGAVDVLGTQMPSPPSCTTACMLVVWQLCSSLDTCSTLTAAMHVRLRSALPHVICCLKYYIMHPTSLPSCRSLDFHSLSFYRLHAGVVAVVQRLCC